MGEERTTLVRSVDSTVEPVTAEELRSHLRITDGSEDADLGRWLKEARQYCEDITGRQFTNATFILYLDSFPTEIELAKCPVSSVTHVKYYNTANVLTTLTAVTDYETDLSAEPARIRAAYGTSWPSTYDCYKAVVVEFVAGYGAAATNVPECFRHAIKLLAGHWYEHREAVVLNDLPRDVQLTLRHLLWVDAMYEF